MFWVDLADIDFALGSPVSKLAVSGGAIFAGNTAEKFVDAEPFEFLEAKAE